MNYKDILAMADAYKEVAEATAKQRALANVKAQPKDKVSLAKAPWEKKDAKKESAEVAEATAKQRALANVKAQPKDKVSLAKAPWEKKDAKKESMDPVDKGELKGKHKDRKDKDIDNDGDVDSSDKYLHKRRKAVSKAMKGKETEVEVQANEEVELDEDLKMVKKEKDPKGGYIVTLKDKKGKLIKRHMKDGKVTDMKEEVELDEAPRRKGAPKMKGDSFAIQRAKDNAHDDAMGRTKTGRKKPVRTMTSTQRSLASMRNEDVERTEITKEAKDHGNTDNGSKAGEGLSPSAKKELDRKTPINPATDEPAVDNLNFKTFKTMTKKSPMRSGDNAAGDKTMPKNAGK